MKNKGFILIEVVVAILVVAVILGYFLSKNTNSQKKESSISVASLKPSPTQPQKTNFPSSIPTIKPTPVLTPTPISTSTPTPRSFEEEEKLMRKTLAGFEMYIGVKNTAGALSFFTPPKTASAKAKYEEIRTKNLPFGLRSWSFVEDSNYKLVAEPLNNGYRVRVNECRTNSDSCTILYFELVRNQEAENGFLVDRYYTSAYGYQNNLGEEIKYQGFGF